MHWKKYKLEDLKITILPKLTIFEREIAEFLKNTCN